MEDSSRFFNSNKKTTSNNSFQDNYQPKSFPSTFSKSSLNGSFYSNSKNSAYGNSHTHYSKSNHFTKKEFFPISYHDDVAVSKEIVRILRHGKYQINMDNEGYVKVDDILNNTQFKNICGPITFDKIKEIVENNDKKRFELKNQGSDYFIKATQGHTVKVDHLSLSPISNPKEYPNVFHGTYEEAWTKIQQTGLRRMDRNHIHFAIGLPDDPKVISGMRKSSDIAIEIDMEKAMQDGLKFFISSNGVVLSEGDRNGVIHPKYFQRVMRLRPLQLVHFKVPPDFEPENAKNEKISSTENQPKKSTDETSQVCNEVNHEAQPPAPVPSRDKEIIVPDESNADGESEKKLGDESELSGVGKSEADTAKNVEIKKKNKKKNKKKSKPEEEASQKEVANIDFVLPTFLGNSAPQSVSHEEKPIKSKDLPEKQMTNDQNSSKKKNKERNMGVNASQSSNPGSTVKSLEKPDTSLKTTKSKKQNAVSKQKSDTEVNAEGELEFVLPSAYQKSPDEVKPSEEDDKVEKKVNKKRRKKR